MICNNIMIIALTAPKGSGKDLVADYIVEKYHYEKIAYADHLKDILRLTFGFSEKELYGTQEDKERINDQYGVSARQMALEFGDFLRYQIPNKYPEYKEKMGSDYFVKYLINKIKKSGKSYVISDVRFNNEISELREAFPDTKIVLIRLNRNTNGFNKQTDGHHSEDPNNIDLKQIDMVIDNNGTIEELYSKVNDCIWTTSKK